MRPLPRLFAVTDLEICRSDDFGARAAAILAGGSAVGIVVRCPGASPAEALKVTDRAASLARPAEAAVFAHGDPAIARAAGVHGVQLRAGDLSPADARGLLGPGWIGVSVHEPDEARRARESGADFVLAGSVYHTKTHPSRTGRGLAWLEDVVAVGLPVIAIGGISADRVSELRAAGAWGVAAISALWAAGDPSRATMAFLEAFGA